MAAGGGHLSLANAVAVDVSTGIEGGTAGANVGVNVNVPLAQGAIGGYNFLN